MSWENLFYAICEQQDLIRVNIVHCLDSIIPILVKSKISSLCQASVAEQASLSLPWSQTPKKGFLVTWLIYFYFIAPVRFLFWTCVAGGMVLVKCVTSSSSGENEILLQMDYITDVVVSNKTMYGTPYVSPDSRNVVIVDEHSGQIKVFTVTQHGMYCWYLNCKCECGRPGP